MDSFGSPSPVRNSRTLMYCVYVIYVMGICVRARVCVCKGCGRLFGGDSGVAGGGNGGDTTSFGKRSGRCIHTTRLEQAFLVRSPHNHFLPGRHFYSREQRCAAAGLACVSERTRASVRASACCDGGGVLVGRINACRRTVWRWKFWLVWWWGWWCGRCGGRMDV